jgi:hypothetical protein
VLRPLTGVADVAAQPRDLTNSAYGEIVVRMLNPAIRQASLTALVAACAIALCLAASAWASRAPSQKLRVLARIECQHPVTTGVEVSDLRGVSRRTACKLALGLHKFALSGHVIVSCGPNNQWPMLVLHRWHGWRTSLLHGFTLARGDASFAVGGTDFSAPCGGPPGPALWNGSNKFRSKPHLIAVSCADGGSFQLRWQSWTGTRAVGSGTAQDCHGVVYSKARAIANRIRENAFTRLVIHTQGSRQTLILAALVASPTSLTWERPSWVRNPSSGLTPWPVTNP